MAVEQQQQRYQEADARHKTELEQIRQAGHDSLAIIVEEYKVRNCCVCMKVIISSAETKYHRYSQYSNTIYAFTTIRLQPCGLHNW